MVNRLESLIGKYRLPLILVLNFGVTAFSYFIALCLRFEFNWDEILRPNRLLLPVCFLLLFRHAAYVHWRLNQSFWRYVSTHDAFRILKAHFASSLCLTASILLFQIEEFPRSVLFIEFAISILLSAGTRLLTRMASEKLFSSRETASAPETRDVVVIGAGDSGHLLVKNMLAHKRLSYRPVAVLDDNERYVDTAVHGVPVYGPLSALEDCLAQHPHVSAVIVAIPTLSPKRSARIESVCRSIGVPLKKLQAFEDLACIDGLARHDGISIESVLEKEIHVEHEDEIHEQIRGRRVLVTGAGGSIGSELVRQILAFGPSELVMLDNSEYNLFTLNRELNGSYPDVTRHVVIASITDRPRLHQVFDSSRPEFIFHAAAYKHVPLMEDNCYEAFRNNIVGTKNLLDLAVQFEVRRFVLISSDKAVAPSSVMGCSKLIAEMLVQQYAAAAEGLAENHPLGTAVVRFGNVINSTGSVIPIFKAQIMSGGPITVTHPDMERYFMSIREAVRLVLTAGILGERGEIYLLDMGKPIKIVDVARKMLALYGRRDIEIVFTGTRPGEKLSEELLSSAELWTRSRFKKVNRVQHSIQPALDVSRWVSDLESRLANMDNTEIKRIMFDLARRSRAEQERELRVAS